MLLACCTSRTQRCDDIHKPAPLCDHDHNSHAAAQLSHKQKLRTDPLADVLGPLFVDCHLCSSCVELSPSTYDPFHQQKHRQCCVKSRPLLPAATDSLSET